MLPPAVSVDDVTARAIAHRHGLTRRSGRAAPVAGHHQLDLRPRARPRPPRAPGPPCPHPLLVGYRQAGGRPEVTDAADHRRKLQLDLWALPLGARPGTAWGERPVARLTDLMLHLASPTGAPWRALVED